MGVQKEHVQVLAVSVYLCLSICMNVSRYVPFPVLTLHVVLDMPTNLVTHPRHRRCVLWVTMPHHDINNDMQYHFSITIIYLSLDPPPFLSESSLPMILEDPGEVLCRRHLGHPVGHQVERRLCNPIPISMHPDEVDHPSGERNDISARQRARRAERRVGMLPHPVDFNMDSCQGESASLMTEVVVMTNGDNNYMLHIRPLRIKNCMK